MMWNVGVKGLLVSEFAEDLGSVGRAHYDSIDLFMSD